MVLDSDDRLSLGKAVMSALDELATLSERPGALARVYLSGEHRRANELIASWMRAAGMSTRVDAIGNVIGRYEGEALDMPALLLGSHLDTVRDAGKYDGALGVVVALACVSRLARLKKRLPFAVEIAGFCDEEGTRFGATLFGSRAIAGTFDPAVLRCRDDNGTSLTEALTSFGLNPAMIGTAARRREEFLGFVEVHIEQGPVLESAGLAVGCVTAINGVTRALVRMAGVAGHAGTVPMPVRHDALAATAECMLALERRCSEDDLRGTVGKLGVSPGAVNVIPGLVEWTVDIRSSDDATRDKAFADVETEIRAIAARRGVKADIEITQENEATACAPWIMRQIDRAIEVEGIVPLRLPSGAGHDGMAIAALMDIGMIFVRCAGGISHNPMESITADDAAIATDVLYRFIENFKPEARA